MAAMFLCPNLQVDALSWQAAVPSGKELALVLRAAPPSGGGKGLFVTVGVGTLSNSGGRKPGIF